MSLNKRIKVIPFRGGVSEKYDPLQLDTTSFARMENAVFTTLGRIEKRNGYEALPTVLDDGSGNITSGQALMSYGNELVLADGTTLYSFNEGSNAWVSKGPFLSCNITQAPIVRDTNTQITQDGVTLASGLQAYCWEDSSGGCRYQIVDGNTGQPVVASTAFPTDDAIKPKVQALGNVFVFWWYDTTTHLLYVATLSGAAPQNGLTAVTITNAIGGTTSVNQTYPNYDVTTGPSTQTGGQQMYAAYYNAAGSTTLIRILASAPTVVQGIPTIVSVVSRCLNVFWDPGAPSGSVVFVYYDGTNMAYIAYDANLSTTYGSGGLATPGAGSSVIGISGVGVSTTTTDLRIFATLAPTSPASQTQNYSVFMAMIGGSWEITAIGLLLVMQSAVYTTTTATTLKIQCALSGKAFAYNGIAYAPIVHQSHAAGTVTGVTYPDPNQTTYFIINDSADLIGRYFYGTAGGIPSRDSVLVPGADNLGVDTLPETTALGDGQFRVSVLQRNDIDRRVVDASGTPIDPATTTLENPTPQIVILSNTGVAATTLDLSDTEESYLRAELANTLHSSGGFLWMYDGLQPVEHGFHLYPDYCQAVASSGGSLAAGVHSYCVVYSWVDQRGQTHYSAPSVPSTITAALNQKATIAFPYLSMTAKQAPRSNVIVQIYRTVIDPATAAVGTIYYKVGEVENVPTSSGASFIDTSTEAAALSGLQLYTSGGVIANTEPDPVGSITTHRNRLFTVSTTDPLTIYYSKIAQPGVPAEFSFEAMYLSIDPAGGPVTAIASMDDKLIIFKSSRILMVTGQGPNDLGLLDDFSDSILVTTDAGCINPRSIVTTPNGLMFQSRKGIYLLDRGLSASYIGAPVESYNSMTVTSGQLIRDTNQIRFTLAVNDTYPKGVALCFDYYANAWSVFTNVNAIDSAIWQETFTYLRPTGIALTETLGQYTDAGQPIRMLATTAWIQLAGLQGYQRVYRFLLLGQYFSPHNLQINIATNYDSDTIKQSDLITPEQFTTWGSDSVWGGSPNVPTDTTVWGGSSAVYQWRIDMNENCQKSEALQITLYDVPDGTPGKSASLSALTVYWGQKKGPYKMPSGNTYG